MSKPTVPTITIEARVTLTIAPRVGQTDEEATVEFLRTFRGALCDAEGSFGDDYGSSVDEIAAWRADPDETDDPTWGGYEGPFLVDAEVERTAITTSGE